MSRYTSLLRCYRASLYLYPKPYRDKYGDQMVQTLADMLNDAGLRPKDQAKIWLRTIREIPANVGKQQLSYIGDVMTQGNPQYSRLGLMLCTAMLMPFAAALSANLLDQLLWHHTLYSSWLWGMPLLAVWVLWLPAAAAALALILLVRSIWHETGQNQKTSLIASIIHAWPLTAVGIAGVAIVGMVFFHDSVHCVTGNPIREARNLQATLHCVEQR